ncbi:MAG TPA: carbamoyltransferase HypF [Candidatus Binataceae bacterium]|nr:carbamoyltransferase HypF [Candidatus Binataceae bacterium]
MEINHDGASTAARGETLRPERHARESRRRISVTGIVQGIGFRPFVWSLATRHHLGGFVANDSRGVIIEVEGDHTNIARFMEALVLEVPPLAVIENVASSAIAPTGGAEFAIVESQNHGERQVLVSPDIATCEDCLREIFDPADRRYRYPFTNCTNCGPRLTIIRDVPYDRAATTMSGFAMCRDCAREYRDPRNRRFHAQPVCCPACGPRLRLIGRDGAVQPGDPISAAAELLRTARIIAIKGLGGYHLAALAHNEAAVARLRSRKNREEKPFAVMVPDLAAARVLTELDPLEEQSLASSRKPIVLLPRRVEGALARSVAPRNRFVGLMLPYTPLHHLLCEALRAPFVLTSGNLSDEPIAYDDSDAVRRLSAVADFFLTHDRPIHTRTDDSVVRVMRGRETPIRRSRGYAPQPIGLRWRVERPILGCGAELKNTFCLAKNRHAFMSHHIGDLENFQTLRAFRDGIEHYRRLFEIEPHVVAFDLHPEYLSTKYALELDGVELVGVQHHHAHVAACLADNGEEGPAIGVAFDGLGYGLDGTLWGGEFMIADLTAFERAGYFAPVPMPGGTAAIKHPWRMAAAYLDAVYGADIPNQLEVITRHRQWSQIVRLARTRLNSPLTSSVGRLFDAVASILGVRDSVTYEGQAAVELEQIARVDERFAYPLQSATSLPFVVSSTELIRAIVENIEAGAPTDAIAARFHNTLARIIVDGCCAIRAERGVALVALSGGVFQNQLLLTRALPMLEEAGFRVLTHRRVPTNDGGISLGQVAVAAARDRAAAARDPENARLPGSPQGAPRSA